MRQRGQSSETTAASKVATVAQADGNPRTTQRDEQATIPISWALVIVVSFSICIRAAVSLSPYSGKLTHQYIINIKYVRMHTSAVPYPF